MNYCEYCRRSKNPIAYQVDNMIFDSRNCIIDYYRIHSEKFTEDIKTFFRENKLPLKAN